MNSLLLLGTGPGAPVRGRFCSSYVLRSGGACVLVDAGEPCSQRLLESDVSPAVIDAVLITHGHSDHTGGLGMLIQAMWLAPRRKPLEIFIPGELIAPLRAWLDAVFLPEMLLGFPLAFRAWSAGEPVDVAPGVRVTPFPTTHLDSLRRIIEPSAKNRFKTFGLAVECAERRVVFSSDLGAPEDMAGAVSEPCDLLVCELSHFTPESLFGFLRGKPVRRLVLTHLGRSLAGREDEIAAMARAALPGAELVSVARDGAEVEF